MGCFNHKANFSQLPVKYGDRIVVIVGIRPKNIKPDDFAPGTSFVPISVPIRGKYNDYGSIEEVDMTPGIEKLEEFFGMDVEKIVDCAERVCCDCEGQIENIDDINELLDGLVDESGYKSWRADFGVELSYVMEHEHIFDYLVSTANVKMKDRYFWKIPHDYIESLGYKKNMTGVDNGYEQITWTHETLPTLKEDCYVWLENEFGNYGKTSHTMGELCKKIGCAVPPEYDESYFENRFKVDVASMSPENKREHVIKFYRSIIGHKKADGTIFDESDVEKAIKDFDEGNSDDDFDFLFYKSEDNNYSFKKVYAHYGLFNQQEGFIMDSLILRTLGKNQEHLDLQYMKEVVEIASIINALRNLQMTWGVTNYYRQDINYDDHINFLQECLDVAKEKKSEYCYDENEE